MAVSVTSVSISALETPETIEMIRGGVLAGARRVMKLRVSDHAPAVCTRARARQ
jgi:hypothetical protein